MIAVLFVLLGGAAGAVLRWLVSRADGDIPWRMMGTNVSASAIAAAFADLDGSWQWVMNVGVLGALSTWSSLAVSAAKLARADQKLVAAAVLLGTVAGSIAAAAIFL